MKRRLFGKLLAVVGISSTVKSGLSAQFSTKKLKDLPAAVNNGASVEICINSRYSIHSGYSANLPDQVIANILWAALKAPKIADSRNVYAALDDNLYLCSIVNNKLSLEVHASGDKRVDSSSALQVGITTSPENVPEDAGVALHWAQLASIAFWNDVISGNPASLPSEAAWNMAKKTWNTENTLHLVTCFGLASSVEGLKNDCVAISYDGSLPKPETDGGVTLEEAISSPIFGSDFKDGDVTQKQLSQILWASYGCTPHTVIGGNNAANAVASHYASYFLQGKIYIVSSEGVKKYQIRKTSSDKVSREHRVVTVGTEDKRSGLRECCSRLSQNAPVYIVYCGDTIEVKQLLEAGFAGAGALLQATALGLQGYYTGRFSEEERNALQNACGIVAADLPMLVFSIGRKAGTRMGREKIHRKPIYGFTASPVRFKQTTTFTVDTLVPYNKAVIMIYDVLGRIVRELNLQGKGVKKQTVYWDGANSNGRSVVAGTYNCVIDIDGTQCMLKLTKV